MNKKLRYTFLSLSAVAILLINNVAHAQQTDATAVQNQPAGGQQN